MSRLRVCQFRYHRSLSLLGICFPISWSLISESSRQQIAEILRRFEFQGTVTMSTWLSHKIGISQFAYDCAFLSICLFIGGPVKVANSLFAHHSNRNDRRGTLCAKSSLIIAWYLSTTAYEQHHCGQWSSASHVAYMRSVNNHPIKKCWGFIDSFLVLWIVHSCVLYLRRKHFSYLLYGIMHAFGSTSVLIQLEPPCFLVIGHNWMTITGFCFLQFRSRVFFLLFIQCIGSLGVFRS